MFVASFILVISVAALVQFAAFSWRAGFLRVASELLPNEGDAVSDPTNQLQIKDFDSAAAIQQLCPEPATESGPSLRAVRLYYGVLQFANSLAAPIRESGKHAAWTQREMALCTRYVTAVLSQRVTRNQALAAEARLF